MAKKRSKPKRRIAKRPVRVAAKPAAPAIDQLKNPKVKVIGIGGGGCSIVSEIARIFSTKRLPSHGAPEFIVANVDYKSLRVAPHQTKKFYFGQDITYGLGCGMNPELGEQAANQVKEKIKKELGKADLCIFIASLGGGTGSGATPIFVEAAESLKLINIGILTLPFKFEGGRRMAIARESIKKIKSGLNAVSVIPNQKIFEIIDAKTSLKDALSSMNKILAQNLEGLIDLVYSTGTINLDFADLKSVLKERNRSAFLGSAVASGNNRAKRAVDQLIKNPLLDYKFETAQKFLFNIAGSKNMKMKEVEEVCKNIFQFNPKAQIIFGITQKPEMKNKIKITLLAVEGEEPKEEKPQEIKKTKTKKRKTKKEEPKKAIPKTTSKARIRRNALDLHQMVKESEDELLEEEKKWDIPAFLRKSKA
ncbi:MAG: cell division protein FtsZ [Candidatus Paceibacterota bacterium]|jgi:cell division protein FtsZ